jgi:uroporphyrin-III C-methyltransferase
MIDTISIIEKEPRLTLVGAGPGDAELITVKAINTLKKADVVLYDALVSADILEWIPKRCPCLFSRQACR